MDKKRLSVVLVVAAGALTAAWAGSRLHSWRQGEQDRRIRKTHTITGSVTRYPGFRSQVLGEERRVWVYLPPMYEAEVDRHFPVLYMHDGQNVFDGATAYQAGQEWEADEAAERLIAEGRIEPVIIVALDHGGERRAVEYTPTRDRRLGGGGADLHRRVMVEELKPWVDETFRTRSGPEHTGIAGSSLGGLVSLWVGLSHPEVFGRIAALSPSVFWDDGHILGFIESLPRSPETLVWTDMGTIEGRTNLRNARRLRDTLVARGWTDGVDLTYVEAEGAPHNETAWARRFPRALEFLFPPVRADEVERNDLDG